MRYARRASVTVVAEWRRRSVTLRVARSGPSGIEAVTAASKRSRRHRGTADSASRRRCTAGSLQAEFDGERVATRDRVLADAVVVLFCGLVVVSCVPTVALGVRRGRIV